MARATVERVFGEAVPTGPEALAAQRDLWHLSVSWRGGYPVESSKLLLADLIVALGVPAHLRDGYQPMRVLTPAGMAPQVTHWTWKDPS